MSFIPQRDRSRLWFDWISRHQSWLLTTDQKKLRRSKIHRKNSSTTDTFSSIIGIYAMQLDFVGFVKMALSNTEIQTIYPQLAYRTVLSFHPLPSRLSWTTHYDRNVSGYHPSHCRSIIGLPIVAYCFTSGQVLSAARFITSWPSVPSITFNCVSIRDMVDKGGVILVCWRRNIGIDTRWITRKSERYFICDPCSCSLWSEMNTDSDISEQWTSVILNSRFIWKYLNGSDSTQFMQIEAFCELNLTLERRNSLLPLAHHSRFSVNSERIQTLQNENHKSHDWNIDLAMC
jgi:hypothetical protein